MMFATNRLTRQVFALSLLAWATACGDGPEPKKAPNPSARPGPGDGGASAVAGGSGTAPGEAPAGTGGSGASGGAGGGGSVEPLDCSDGNACTWDRATGNECDHRPLPDGTSCSDGDLCTAGDRCFAGACVAGPRLATRLEERGRVESFGSDVGAVLGWDQGRFLFVEPTGYGAAVHLAEASPSGVNELAHLGADDPSAQSLYLSPHTRPVLASWDGHAVVGAGFDSVFSLIVRSPSDDLTAYGRLELPLAGGFLQGTLNGATGRAQEAWFCVNASFFAGQAFGTLYRFDLSDPAAPQLRQKVASPADCGSLALSHDGARLYVNTRNGFYRFEPAVTDSAGVPTFEGPFFENAGLLVRGERLLARGLNEVRLYAESDLQLLRTIPVANLVGATFFPDLNLVATLRFVQFGTFYEQWLELYDAAPGAPLTPLDGVLVDRIRAPSKATLAQSGEFLVEPSTKALFHVAKRRLERVSTPQVGGVEALVSEGESLQVWGATSYRRLDLTDMATPRWLPAPGPSLGNLLTAGLVVGENAPLVPGAGSRVFNHDLEEWLEDYQLTGRDGGGRLLRSLEGAPDQVRQEVLTLPNDTTGMRVARGDYLYTFSFDTHSALLSRTARGLLTAAGGPTPVEVPVALPVDSLPEGGWWSAAEFSPSLDGKMGIAFITYTPDTANFGVAGAELYWLDLTTATPTLRGRMTVEPALMARLESCRIAGRRAVCFMGYGNKLGFYEWAEDGTPLTSRSLSLEETTLDQGALLAFDGNHVYLSYATGLLALPFTATEEALGASSFIPFSDSPRVLVEVDGGLAVGSGSELVFVSPQCE